MNIFSNVQYDHEFRNTFSDEYYDIILNYVNVIQNTIEKYDVVVFMARKAYCFYLSLCNAGIIKENKNCKILSSRALTYSNIDLTDKSIAVIEDVVIKGLALTSVVSEPALKGKKFDIYIVACSEDFPNKFFNQTHCNIVKAFATLLEKQLLELASLITNFIVNKLTPYNIDTPIFEYKYKNENQLNYVHNYNYSLISDLISDGNKNIEEGVVHLTNKLLSVYIPKSVLDKIIVKVRVYNSIPQKRCLFVPIVIFPELTHEQLLVIFENIFSSKINSVYKNLIDSDINLFKLVNYAISYIVCYNYFDAAQISNCDNILSEEALFGTLITPYINIGKEKEFVSIINYSIERFKLYNYLAYSYDILLQKNDYDESSEYITFNDIELLLSKNIDASDLNTEHLFIYTSLILDIFIDNGIVVPRLCQGDDGIIKKYKFGEVAQLTINDYRVFAKVLKEYSDGENRALDSIEIEKISVMFFRKHNHKFDSNSNNLETFRICYSKFGPRLSTSEKSYCVPHGKALTDYLSANCLLQNTKEGFIIPINPSIEEDHVSNQDCKLFAYGLNIIHKIYDNIKRVDPDNYVLKYVNSYNRLLTLLAIGNDEKSKITSLVAEVDLIKQKKFDIYYYDAKNSIIKLEKIVDGILSGIWKYFCYTEKELSNGLYDFFFRAKISSSDLFVFASVIDSTNAKKLNNMEYFEKISSLLFETALFYYYSAKLLGMKTHSDFDKSPYKYLIFEKTNSNLYFYHDKYKEIEKMNKEEFDLFAFNKFCELSTRASEIVDEFNIYNSSSTLSYISTNKCYVLFDYENIDLRKINHTYFADDSNIIFPIESQHDENQILCELCKQIIDGRGKVLYFISSDPLVNFKYVSYNCYNEKYLQEVTDFVSKFKKTNSPYIREFISVTPLNEQSEKDTVLSEFEFQLSRKFQTKHASLKAYSYTFERKEKNMEIINNNTNYGTQYNTQNNIENISVNNDFSIDKYFNNDADANDLISELKELKTSDNHKISSTAEDAISSINNNDRSGFKKAINWLKENAFEIVKDAALPIILALINNN